MKTGELIAIGGAYVDINAPNFPLPSSGIDLETEVVGGDYVVEPGGSAVNFAKMCAAMDIPTSFIGKVGKDELGRMLANLLLKASVQPLLIESDQVATNVSFNMVNPESKSIMAVVGTANQSLNPDEVYSRASEKIAQSPYVYIGSCFKLKNLMPAFTRLASDAKQSGTKVVLDHGRLNDSVTETDKQTVRELALISDIYLPSRDEFLQLWGYESIEQGILEFSQKSSAIIVVKDGSDGALTVVDGHVVAIPALPVTPIHSIGAGDSFNAGFIASQHKGNNVVDSVKFACAAAALKISRTQLPTYADVTEHMS